MADSRTNLELSATALLALQELKRRGNREIEQAYNLVSSFHDRVLSFQSRFTALETKDDES